MVVAQWTALMLSIPEDPGLNPVIGNFYWTIIYLLLNVCRKDENKEKEVRNGTLKICSSLPCSLFVRKLRFVVQGRVGFPAEAQWYVGPAVAVIKVDVVAAAAVDVADSWVVLVTKLANFFGL